MARKSIFDNLEDSLSDSTDYLLDPGFNGKDKKAAKEAVIKSASEVPIDSLVGFKDHPYRVDEESEDFLQLVDSIRENGILYPILVRALKKGKYEIVSGHRRVAAAKVVGLSNVPVIIRDMNDDEATIAMVHSNFYREKILVSEKAKAYRMCMEAEKHQGIKGMDSAVKAGNEEDSRRQVYRYVRLSYLDEHYLQMIDDGVLAFNSGYELSFLDNESLKALSEYICNFEKVPSLDQSIELKKLYTENNDSLTYEKILAVLTDKKEEKKTPVKVTLNEKKLFEYFKPETSVETMESIIFELLDGYKSGKITLQNGDYADA